jgi:hypothetical protein
MDRIVFPESSQFLRPRPARHVGLTLKQVLVVVYIFGGVSAFLALISKLVVEPLFLQLTADRSDYANLARRLLISLNARLSSAVSYVPPIRSRSGSECTDAQTQTEMATKGEFVTTVEPEKKAVDMSKLCDSLSRLSSCDKLNTTQSVKFALDGVSSYIQTLSYPNIRSLNAADLTVSPKRHSDLVADVKKEIRSIKGSLLSTYV